MKLQTLAAAARPEARWYAHQLAGFLEAVSALDEDSRIAELTVERVAEALAADVCALVRGADVVASFGYESGHEPSEELIAAAAGRRETVPVPGVGAVAVLRSRQSTAAPGLVVLVARALPGGVASDELALLNGIAVATALTLREARSSEVVRLRPAEAQRQDRHEEEEGGADELTGLADRSAFMRRIGQALDRARDAGGNVAVLLVDLDGFKRVNHGLGNDAGDRLLLATARRLAAAAPEDFVARIGGDEFAILVEGLNDAAEGARRMRGIRTALRVPFDIAGQEMVITASIGFGFGGRDAKELMRAAALALAEAQAKGPGGHATYRSGLGAAAQQRLDLEVGIRRALQEGQFVVHYQPIFDLESLEPVSFEALVRWRHPTQGLVAPGRFIPIAEETGLIAPIGRWVLRTACAQLAEWRSDLDGHEQLRVSVNLSPEELRSGTLVRDVEQSIASSGLDPGDLVLEITESVLMEDTADNLKRLEALTALGVSIAIDDFGVGYSSLRYIDRFPIDVVKLDRSFIAAGAEAELPVLGAIIEMTARLGLMMIAEGIEERDQPHRLIEMGCRFGQGLLLAPPAPPAAARALLVPRRSRRRGPSSP